MCCVAQFAVKKFYKQAGNRWIYKERLVGELQNSFNKINHLS